MSSQDLILQRITTAIEASGELVVTNDLRYSNNGTLRVLDAATLAQIGQASYDFQHDYFHFRKMNRDAIVAHWYGQHDTGNNAAYVKASIPEAIDVVVAYLTRGATA